MQYMEFSNPGEVPLNAFKLLGASNKRGDSSKIGFFGTGLKYALAVLLREDVNFQVYSGLKEIKIGKRATKFIDQDVQVMTVNGEKTSITLDAGIDWKGWFAIREIYSNALDEKGSVSLHDVNPEAGFTKIYIDAETTKLGDVFSKWPNYFASTRPALFELTAFSAGGRILSKLNGAQNFRVYRKGILAYETEEMSLYDYDINDLDINESRVVKYSWEALAKSGYLLAHADTPTVERFIKLSTDPKRASYTEWDDSFWKYAGASFTNNWLTIINDRELIRNDIAGKFEITSGQLVLPDELVKKLEACFGDKIKHVGDNSRFTPLPQLDHTPLIDSIKRINRLGYDFSGSAQLVAFTDAEVKGQSEDGKIYISDDLMNYSDRDLDAVVLEKILHTKMPDGDLTRNFQSYLVREILRVGNRNHNGEQ